MARLPSSLRTPHGAGELGGTIDPRDVMEDSLALSSVRNTNLSPSPSPSKSQERLNSTERMSNSTERVDKSIYNSQLRELSQHFLTPTPSPSYSLSPTPSASPPARGQDICDSYHEGVCDANLQTSSKIHDDLTGKSSTESQHFDNNILQQALELLNQQASAAEANMDLGNILSDAMYQPNTDNSNSNASSRRQNETYESGFDEHGHPRMDIYPISECDTELERGTPFCSGPTTIKTVVIPDSLENTMRNSSAVQFFLAFKFETL